MPEPIAVGELLKDGGNLMLLGMLVVFVLLGLLVLVVDFMSRVAQRLGKVPAPIEAPASAPNPDQDLLSVISAAVHRYRRSNGK